MSSLADISRRLSDDLAKHSFAEPTAYVYDPLTYARAPHEAYLERYGKGPKEVLLLGMNPGPFGMAQTGVPFGDVGYVRDFLGITGEVGAPPKVHPKRPIDGFECKRSEVSGSRLWGWVQERFGTADAFFERFFVTNYCPLIFMEEGGKNRVPEKLPKAERGALLARCDESLREVIELLQPKHIVGVGKWAFERAKAAAPDAEAEFGWILHPSPASPKANRGWAPQAEGDFAALGIRLD